MVYSTNFNDRIVASPTTFALTAAQASAYIALHDPYIAAAQAAAVPGAKSKSLISARDAAKAALLAYARQLYGFVQANMTVSDANKDLLGVKVKAAPAPNPPPAVVPAMDIVSVVGGNVKVRLHDASGEGKRSKPPGVRGAAIFSFVGPTPPATADGWRFEGNTTRNTVDVVFPDSVAPGSKVWFCAMWFNGRTESGPPCPAISTTIQYSTPMPAAA